MNQFIGLRRSHVLLVLLAVCATVPMAQAQFVPLAEGGARSLALGRATMALHGDIWGHYNPGGWAALDHGSAALFASQAHGLSELRVVAGAAAYPVPIGVVAASARRYGFEDFAETVIGVGYGYAVPISPTRAILVGAALRYTHVSIPEFVSRGAVGISVGSIVELLPGLDFGAHLFNVNRPELSELDPLESRIDAGIAYAANPRALVLLGVSKDLDYPLSIRGGVELQPVEVLLVRAGFTTEPSRIALGVGVVVGQIRADLAAEHHHVLGLTPAFEIGVNW